MQTRSYARYGERLKDLLTEKESVLAEQDIHLYVDVSGSILAHKGDYFELLRESIERARCHQRLLFITLFGTTVHHRTLELKVQEETIATLWQQFCDILPIGEGTDFLPVWDYILTEPVRNAQLSIMLTDGVWGLNDLSGEVKQLVLPAKLYYALIYTSCLGMPQGSTTEGARRQVRMQNQFTDQWLSQLAVVDPNIGAKLLNRTAPLRARPHKVAA